MRKAEVQGKLEVIPENVAKLQELRAQGEERFHADFRNLDSALHRLQTSVQALIDMGSYIIAELGLRTPGSSAEVIDILSEAGYIDPEKRDRYIGMIQFRNRVVHLDNRIDADLVYKVLHEDIDDIRALYSTLLEIIEQHEEA